MIHLAILLFPGHFTCHLAIIRRKPGHLGLYIFRSHELTHLSTFLHKNHLRLIEIVLHHWVGLLANFLNMCHHLRIFSDHDHILIRYCRYSRYKDIQDLVLKLFCLHIISLLAQSFSELLKPQY